jgi:hypothetical protein
MDPVHLRLDLALQHGQRVPQLVGKHRDELVLAPVVVRESPVGGFERGVGVLELDVLLSELGSVALLVGEARAQRVSFELASLLGQRLGAQGVLVLSAACPVSGPCHSLRRCRRPCP